MSQHQFGWILGNGLVVVLVSTIHVKKNMAEPYTNTENLPSGFKIISFQVVGFFCLFVWSGFVFKMKSWALKKYTKCAGLCRMIAEHACYRLHMLLGCVSLLCFWHKEVARALLADVLLQKQIIVKIALGLRWLALHAAVCGFVHFLWDHSAKIDCFFMGVLFPELHGGLTSICSCRAGGNMKSGCWNFSAWARRDC